MSKASHTKARKARHYETAVPRCGTCIHFRKGHLVLRDSLPRSYFPASCDLPPRFTVDPNAVCDLWQSVTAETLEPMTQGASDV